MRCSPAVLETQPCYNIIIILFSVWCTCPGPQSNLLKAFSISIKITPQGTTRLSDVCIMLNETLSCKFLSLHTRGDGLGTHNNSEKHLFWFHHQLWIRHWSSRALAVWRYYLQVANLHWASLACCVLLMNLEKETKIFEEPWIRIRGWGLSCFIKITICFLTQRLVFILDEAETVPGRQYF